MAEAKQPRKTKTVQNEADELRRGAEERLDRLSDVADSASPALEDVAAIVHELRVHQIELEMQNQELRRAQLELEASRKKYFELFDLAPVGYLTLSRESIVRDANLTATRLLGVDRRQLVKNPFTAFICAPDQDVFYHHQQMLEQTGEPQTCELRLKRAAGEADAEAALGHFWAHLEGRPRAAHGATHLFSVTFADITERKQAERELRLSEAKFSAAFHSSPDLMIITRLSDGLLLEVNEGFTRLLGYERAETVGRTTPELSIWADPQAREAFVARLEASGESGETETVLRRKDGTVITGVHSARSMEVQGEASVLSVVHDVTERKQAEQALRESEARYRGYVDNAPYGVFVSDENGRYLEMNKAAAELTGYTQEELVQLRIADIVAPEFHERARQHFDRVVRTGHSSGNCVFLRKDGSTFPAHVDAVRLAATRYLGFIVDISEQTRAAAEIEASAAQVKQALTATVAALSATTELRDPYTAGHQRRVAQLAGAIAVGLGWDEARIEMVTTAGLLHDVGKIVVPAEILAKPGRLSEAEMEIIRQHATASAALIAGIEFGDPVAAIVNQHHERLDGSGYPQGLRGENILPEARILAVADVVEAMSSHRPYRAALGMEVALAEVREHAGITFDADVVAVCGRLFEEQGFQFTP